MTHDDAQTKRLPGTKPYLGQLNKACHETNQRTEGDDGDERERDQESLWITTRLSLTNVARTRSPKHRSQRP